MIKKSFFNSHSGYKCNKAARFAAYMVFGSQLLIGSAYAVYPCATGYTYFKGYCLRTGSVDCEMGLDRLGGANNIAKSVKCEVAPVGSGILFCTNPGGNQPPAKITIEEPVEPFSNEYQIESKDVTNGGSARITVHVKPTTERLFQLVQEYCPNTNYSADYVPIQMNGSLTLKDTKKQSVMESLGISCALPDPDSLGWDAANQRPESREYICETTSVSW